MQRKKIIMPVVYILLLAVSVCWAAPSIKIVLRDLKVHANMARGQSKDIGYLVNRIHQLAVEIENLSNVTNFKQQKDKIQILERKVDKFQQWVAELDHKTNDLKFLANQLQNESTTLFRASYTGQPASKCGIGKVWIPGHKAANGRWVPGHCARQ